MVVYHKILFTTINKESGLAFSTNTGCADLHGLSDLGFLCSLGCGLQKKINYLLFIWFKSYTVLYTDTIYN